MNKFFLYSIVSLLVFNTNFSFAQETLPVYFTDYLSDNVYLIHPAAAGVGNCSKIRLTGRMQWMNIGSDAPQLQTFNFHGRLGDNNGLGFVAFNDKNGYHSQVGLQLTYAYHINLSGPYETNQLSFGLSAMGVRNTLDESAFTLYDPEITRQILSENYFNTDAGLAYHYEGFSSYFTAKNIVTAARDLYDPIYESYNLRRYLLNIGYFFNNSDAIQFEPSAMVEYVEETQEKFVDGNIKIYVPFENGRIWGGISYRRGFDLSQLEAPNYISPLFGINFKNAVISYSYSHQQNDVVLSKGGFHQLTLGFNFLCKDNFNRQSACPNLNSGF